MGSKPLLAESGCVGPFHPSELESKDCKRVLVGRFGQVSLKPPHTELQIRSPSTEHLQGIPALLTQDKCPQRNGPHNNIAPGHNSALTVTYDRAQSRHLSALKPWQSLIIRLSAPSQNLHVKDDPADKIKNSLTKNPTYLRTHQTRQPRRPKSIAQTQHVRRTTSRHPDAPRDVALAECFFAVKKNRGKSGGEGWWEVSSKAPTGVPASTSPTLRLEPTSSWIGPLALRLLGKPRDRDGSGALGPPVVGLASDTTEGSL